MLIRNARLDHYSCLVDLRLMHGAVQEIGVGLVKGLYESELDLAGDELRPCPQKLPLPRRFARRRLNVSVPDYVAPGTPEPLTRWRDGQMIDVIDQHTAD